MPLIPGHSEVVPQGRFNGRQPIGTGRRAIIAAVVSACYPCVLAVLLTQLTNATKFRVTGDEGGGFLQVSLLRGSTAPAPRSSDRLAPQPSITSQPHRTRRPDSSELFREIEQRSSNTATAGRSEATETRLAGRAAMVASPADPWAQPSLLPVSDASVAVPPEVQNCLRSAGVRVLDVELYVAPDGRISMARDYTDRRDSVVGESAFVSRISACIQPIASRSSGSLRITFNADSLG